MVKSGLPVLIMVALFALLLSSGCVQTTIYSKVKSDGTISDYTLTLNTSSTVYNLIAQSARENGYSSVREMFSDPNNYSQNNENSGAFAGISNLNYNEEWSGSNVRMIFTNRDPVKPDSSSALQIYRDGNYLIYRHRINSTGQQEASSEYSNMAGSLFTLDYYLEMPGTIVESNANTLKDNRAEWHGSLGTSAGMDIYAKSEIPASLPGFTFIHGIFCILIAGLAYGTVRKRR